MKITVEGDDFPKDGYRPTTWGEGDEWVQVRPLWQESNRIIKNMFGNPGVPFVGGQFGIRNIRNVVGCA